MFWMTKNGQEERCLVGRQACICRWPGYGSGRRWHSPPLLSDIRISIPRHNLYNKSRWSLKGGAERIKHSNDLGLIFPFLFVGTSPAEYAHIAQVFNKRQSTHQTMAIALDRFKRLSNIACDVSMCEACQIAASRGHGSQFLSWTIPAPKAPC
jgi:hypothetical protein